MKLIGAVLLITATTMTGIYFSEKLKMRCEIAKELITMSELIEIEMNYNMTDLEDVFKKLPKCSDFKYLHFLNNIDCNMPFYKSFCKSLEYCKSDICEKDLLLLKDFVLFLGSTDIDTQISYIESYRYKMKKRLEFYENEEKRLSKLCVSFGVLGGMAAAIIFI